MKIKRLFIAFGLLATLTACGEGDLVIEDITMEDATEITETVETVDVNPPTQTSSPDDLLVYTDMIREVLDFDVKILESMTNLSNEYISNKALSQDIDYISQFTSDINYLGEIRFILDNTNDVPVEFANSHEKLITVIDFQIGGARQILDGIVQSDSEKILEGTTLLNMGGELMQEYNLEIREIIY